MSLASNWDSGLALVWFLGPLALLVIGPYLYFSTLTVINNGGIWDVFHTATKKRFRLDAAKLLEKGFEQSRDAFHILTDNGPLLVLSPRYAREVRSDDRLSLDHFIAAEFHPDIQGFEPFKLILDPKNPLNTIIKANLTQALTHMTEGLAMQAADAICKAWGEDTEWHEVGLNHSALNIIAQMASKAFVGQDLCQNPEWHRIIITYTHNVYQATQALHFWPKFVRPIVARFLPACQTLQAQIVEARQLIDPILARRRADRDEAIARGESPVLNSDVIDWLENHHRGQPFDVVAAQLLLSFAAIHGTSNLLTQVLIDIAKDKQLVQDIRSEIISVLPQEGWTKTALYQLRLMDSALKESQRLAPTRLLSMGRIARNDLILSGNLQIPRGTPLMVSSRTMWDPEIYNDPLRYDGYRFYKMRQISGQEGQHQLVSATEKHMGFGYGKHACPGRFFAATEIKTALCHMLLKYDIKHLEAESPRVLSHGIHLFPDPTARILIRRRQEEINL